VELALDERRTASKRQKTGTEDETSNVWRYLSEYDHGVYSRASNPKFGKVKSRCQFHLDNALVESEA